MKSQALKRFLAMIFTAGVVFTQSMPAMNVLAAGEGESDAEELSGDEAEDIDDDDTEPELENPIGLAMPTTVDGVSTWDCIWFGSYWQNTDSDGDGKVTQADEKEPIKWRVLDIDADGNALLLSDKSIEKQHYNEGDPESLTWETCTLRAFLNNEFLDNAFSEEERNGILTSDIKNDDNPVYGTDGGNDTKDKVFLLSLEEVMTTHYGFIANGYTIPTTEAAFFTNDDGTRITYSTDYSGSSHGKNYWWLRSVGNPSIYSSNKVAALVYDQGRVSAYGLSVTLDYIYVRPAIRINLSAASSLWSYAGTICSDETTDEKEPGTKAPEYAAVSGVSLNKEEVTLKVGREQVLKATVLPARASRKQVKWSSSKPGVAVVSDDGVITAMSVGTAVITATTVEGEKTASCSVTVTKNENMINPCTARDVSTWDCIWFGSYWQDTDSDGDGKVTKEDTKDPIKWRVLDIDEEGNALLLADRNIEKLSYSDSFTLKTWEDSILRSYLNNEFMENAFSEAERNVILTSVLKNDDNPVFKSDGGNETNDQVFCLSLEEAMNADYGFVANQFINGSKANAYKTGRDPSRLVVGSVYTGFGVYQGFSWWLRSPGDKGSYPCAAIIDIDGEVDAYGDGVLSKGNGVRPAIRINLSASEGLWKYAGTVCSDGTVIEDVSGGSDPAPVVPDVTPDDDIIIESDDTDINMIPGEVRRLSVSEEARYIYGIKWTVETADPAKCVTVNNGVVTAKKAGKATVKASYGGNAVTFSITVDETSPKPTQIDGGKKFNISATKSVKATVGDTKTKKVTLTVPANMRDAACIVGWEISDESVCSISGPVFNKEDRTKASKAGFEITALEAGAVWIVWSMTDKEGNVSQAVTKVIVKKPLDRLSVSKEEINLNIGGAERIRVTGTGNNTDTKNVTFSVKGKGIKVSRTGYVMATKPGTSATVTVKYGKVSKTVKVNVEDFSGDYVILNKTSVNVSIPKAGKTKSVNLKISKPKNKAEKPALTWSVLGEPKGITVSNGKVSVTSEAAPGSYLVKAAGGPNNVYCEIIVK